MLWLAKILAAINSNKRPGELAAGLACAVWLALLPTGNLLWLGLFILAFLIKLNLAMFLVGLAIFSPLAVLLDPPLSRLGLFLLSLSGLEPLFTTLYNLPFLALTRFNDSLVLGAFTIGLALLVPLFFLFRWLVVLYRQRWRQRLLRSRLVKAFQKFPLARKFFGLYQRAASLYANFS